MLTYNKYSYILFFLIISGVYIISLKLLAANNIDELVQNAIRGNTIAQMQLGDIYQEGEGVLQDYSKSHAWYRAMALFGDNSSSEKVNNLQQEMTDEEIFNAVKEYNNIYSKISKTTSNNKETFRPSKVFNCDTANFRVQSLKRTDQYNFQNKNDQISFCQLADASLIIWSEIERIVKQCPALDTNGLEAQFAKESIYWATETKLRTCDI